MLPKINVIPHFFTVKKSRNKFYIAKHDKIMRDWRAGPYSTAALAQEVIEKLGNDGKLATLKE